MARHDVWEGLLPKVDTQALAFLEHHPDFDGRGVVVGVLDTGVDPGAVGLLLTSTGQPKVIDIVDCSGSGDVSMSAPVAAVDGKVPTADGRLLTVSAGWTNPSGMFRLGVKRAYELFPRGLKERVMEERRKSFDKQQREVRILGHLDDLSCLVEGTLSSKRTLVCCRSHR